MTNAYQIAVTKLKMYVCVCLCMRVRMRVFVFQESTVFFALFLTLFFGVDTHTSCCVRVWRNHVCACAVCVCGVLMCVRVHTFVISIFEKMRLPWEALVGSTAPLMSRFCVL